MACSTPLAKLTEMADPQRPELAITPFFRTNAEYLVLRSGSSEAAISRRCGLHCKAVGALIHGAEPTALQIVRLAQYFEMMSRKLLMEDLRPEGVTEALDWDLTGRDLSGSKKA